MTDITLKGVREMRQQVAKLNRTLSRALEAAVKDECESILTRSKAEFVPVDQGTLRDDSGVEVTREPNGEVTGSIYYGKGDAAPYALAIHEYPSSHNPPTWPDGTPITFHPPGRGPKYLELPFNEAQDGMIQRIADTIKTKLPGA